MDQEALAASRKLGDEWDGWSGELEENNGDLTTSPWMFISYMVLVLMMVHVAVIFGWYLAAPRLIELGEWVNKTVIWTALFGLTLLDVGSLLLILTVWTGKNWIPLSKGKHIALSPVLPAVYKVAQKMGISKDRLSNSILQIGNRVTIAQTSVLEKEEVLILLPRCLSKETRDEIKAITDQYDIEAHFCAGGQIARQLLVEKKPKGVIAVACERDLMAGVQDVKAAIPVIAIANKRPEGPCRNTNIDLSEMESALQTFLKK